MASSSSSCVRNEVVLDPIHDSSSDCSLLENFIQKKVQLLVKKVQDRKSTEIYTDDHMSLDDVTNILEISDSQNGSVSSKKSISILSTMKSIAHTTQSKARWAKFAADNGVSEHIYTFSSKGDFSKVHQIMERIVETDAPKHIVMCTNQVRFRDLLSIVNHIEKVNTRFKDEEKVTFRLYFDEMDKYIDTLRSYINELAISIVVSRIVIVTATPKKIWSSKGWEKLFVLNPRVIDGGENYLMFKECKYYPTEAINPSLPIDEWFTVSAKQNKKLIEHHNKIRNAYPGILNVDNSSGKPIANVIFAPGLQSRSSHEDVARFWNTLGCSVIIVNGERTNDGFYGRLYLSDRSQVDIPHMNYEDFETPEMNIYLKSNPDYKGQAQLNDIIAEYYHKHHLYTTPLVITGRLCVERAQSLVHPVWGTFTDAIYFESSDPDDAYQQQRQLGHIKHWSTFRGIPRVYAPQHYHDDVIILEERSHKFATIYASSHATHKDYLNISSEGKLTTKEHKEERIIARSHTSELIKTAGPFANFDDVSKFLRSVFGSSVRPRPMFEIEGYKLSTRLKAYYKKDKESLIADDRLTNEKFKRFEKSAFGISSTERGQQYMIYPVYPTMTSSPDEVMYFIRYLPQLKE